MSFFRLSFIAILPIALAGSFFSCQSDPKQTGPEENLKKLPSITCFLQIQTLFETEVNGVRYFIDANGNISTSKIGLTPISTSGTGVLLEGNNYIGTVKHLYNINFQEFCANNENFRLNFLSKLSEKGWSSESISNAQCEPNTIVAWFALPKTPKIPIENSLKNDPFKVPEGCYTMELIMHGGEYIDLAIFKILDTGKIQNITGFSIDDISDEAAIEKIELGEDICTWGYPLGWKGWTNQIIEPQPKDARVTATPNASGAILQTDIESNFGGSGSFILSKKTGKAIGILIGVDRLNQSNSIGVPASYIRRLLRDLINNPTTKSKL